MRFTQISLLFKTNRNFVNSQSRRAASITIRVPNQTKLFRRKISEYNMKEIQSGPNLGSLTMPAR